MLNIIVKTILIRGDKGDTGSTGGDTTAPRNALFYFDETTDAPEGYEDYEE